MVQKLQVAGSKFAHQSSVRCCSNVTSSIRNVEQSLLHGFASLQKEQESRMKAKHAALLQKIHEFCELLTFEKEKNAALQLNSVRNTPVVLPGVAILKNMQPVDALAPLAWKIKDLTTAVENVVAFTREHENAMTATRPESNYTEPPRISINGAPQIMINGTPQVANNGTSQSQTHVYQNGVNGTYPAFGTSPSTRSDPMFGNAPSLRSAGTSDVMFGRAQSLRSSASPSISRSDVAAFSPRSSSGGPASRLSRGSGEPLSPLSPTSSRTSPRPHQLGFLSLPEQNRLSGMTMSSLMAVRGDR